MIRTSDYSGTPIGLLEALAMCVLLLAAVAGFTVEVRVTGFTVVAERLVAVAGLVVAGFALLVRFVVLVVRFA